MTEMFAGAGRAPKALLCLLSVASLPFVLSQDGDQPPALTKTGPQACPNDDSVSGYISTTALTVDMLLDHDEIVTNLLSSGNPAPTYDDMTQYIKGKENQYIYTLCPNTLFDLGDVYPASKPGETSDRQTVMPMVPFIPSSVIQCGPTGSAASSCTIKGGLFQVVFEDDHLVTNVTFAGITFTDDRLISVAAYGHRMNDGYFVGCVWQNNENTPILVDLAYDPDLEFGIIEPKPSGRRLGADGEISKGMPISKLAPRFRNRLSMDYETSSKIANRAALASSSAAVDTGRQLQDDTNEIWPGMLAGFFDCAFLSNGFGFGILNEGGRLDIDGTTFKGNKGVALVVVISFGQLALHGGSAFADNEDMIGPVFLDSTAMIVKNDDVVGGGNRAMDFEGVPVEDACPAIFKEDADGSNCLERDSLCSGRCCDFGMPNCFEDDEGGGEDIESPSVPKGVTVEKRGGGGGGGGGCGTTCIVIATVVPVCTIALILFGVWFVRSSRRKNAPPPVESPVAPTNEFVEPKPDLEHHMA